MADSVANALYLASDHLPVFADFAIGMVSTVEASTGEATTFSLDQNYPNPFNVETRITFSLMMPAFTSLAIYDATGRRVKLLLDEMTTKGLHHVSWAGRTDAGGIASSGIYFYTLETPEHKIARKLVLLR